MRGETRAKLELGGGQERAVHTPGAIDEAAVGADPLTEPVSCPRITHVHTCAQTHTHTHTHTYTCVSALEEREGWNAEMRHT